MGDYYTLRCSVPLSEFGAIVVNNMVQEPWADWGDMPRLFAAGAAFAAQFERADFIPKGSLAYEPDGWREKVNRIVQDEEGRHIWQFSCSVKIARSTRQMIDEFMSNVASRLSSAPTFLLLYHEHMTDRLEQLIVDPLIKGADSMFVHHSTRLFTGPTPDTALRWTSEDHDARADWYEEVSLQTLGW